MSRSTKPSTMLMFKAFVFMAKHAQIESLMSCLETQAVKALAAHKPSEVKKKEAWPLPFDLVVKMESLVNDPGTAPWTVLLPGFFLVCIWASLREADALCSSPSAIVVGQHCITWGSLAIKEQNGGTCLGLRSLGVLAQPASMGTGPTIGFTSCWDGSNHRPKLAFPKKILTS